MTTTSTAGQIKSTDTITALWAGCRYTGAVRSVDHAAYSSTRYGVEYVLIAFVGGGSWPGQDQSITLPASQIVELH